ncbi:TetR/AcrR family transcriptional regulator [Terasakiella sp. A23]|uniref:TetR/AcrR family transcriptional regulator n=1 Tax=Terasakiella sp. FCG-A23 TaxID=3080561 RepID=UPI002954AC6D|nr:TetR/AcrR family transcriptional regulator [Terasakiella sp. A23]MDV7341795.1 TetR/AcrR family transcriptional regulator [Terasakiella sp. A23]
MKNQECLFQIWRKRKAEADMTRNEKKRFDIIEAARQVFLEKGFELTSMDEIAKRAKVSKRTVYSNFGSKEDLFSGLMHEVCESKREKVELYIDEDLPLEEALNELGRRFLQMIFEPEGMNLVRMMIGNANAFPQMGDDFYKQGPKEVIEYVAAYLDSWAEKGVLKIEDSFISAQGLLASMFGVHQMKCLMSNCEAPDSDMQAKMVRIAVSQFLHGTKA